MITSEEFRRRWFAAAGEEPFVRYEPSMLDGVAIPQVAWDFLLAAGLPVSAAPFLNIKQPRRSPLQSVAQAWKLPEAFDRYRMIGFDGAGSPLCIEDGSGRVVILDHDRSFAAQHVNSSPPQFAESLLVYQEFVEEVVSANGEDAWLDNDIPSELHTRLARELERIDEGGVAVGSFWHEELRRLAQE